MRYNLSSNQAHRINFDEAVERYAQDCATSMDADYLAEAPASEIAEAYYEGFDTDDEVEAKAARYTNVFTTAINEAKSDLS